MKILIEFERGTIGTTARIVNSRIAGPFLRELVKRGFPEGEDSALVQNVELNDRAKRDLERFGYCRILMDRCDVGNLFGYDGAEIMEELAWA